MKTHRTTMSRSILRSTLVLIGFLLVPPPLFSRETILIVTEDWEPYAGQGLPGGGVLVELVREVFRETNFDVRVEYYPWSRALKMAEKGQADGLLGAFYSEERAQYLDYPRQLMEQETALFHWADGPSPDSLEDPSHLEIGRVRNAVNGSEFDQRKDGVVELTNLDQCINMLVLGRIDLFAGPVVNVEYLLQTKFPQYVGKIQKVQPVLGRQGIYCAISKKSTFNGEIKSIFDSRLVEMITQGEYSRILKRNGFLR